jgi:hypothetical protein
MMSCKEVSQLAAESAGKALPMRKRMAVKFHLMMCRACSRFVRQMALLKKACAVFQEKDDSLDSLPGLTPAAKDRIKKSLE